MEDLIAGRLRTPIDPAVSFGDDPLRMLRGARFSSQLDFVVDPDTLDAIRELRSSLAIVSPERVQAELVRLLQTDDPVRGIRVLVETGLIDEFLPEVPALRLEVDEHHHHKDVYEHSLTVLRQAIALEKQRHPDAAPRCAPAAGGAPARHRQARHPTPRSGGGVTFHHHDIKGARMARKRLQACGSTRPRPPSSPDWSSCTALLRLAEGAWTDAAVRRYVRDAGDELERLHILTRADVTTRNKRKAQRLASAYDDIEARIAALREQEEIDSIRPELDGNRIQEVLGLTPGREVGEATASCSSCASTRACWAKKRPKKRLREWWAARG